MTAFATPSFRYFKNLPIQCLLAVLLFLASGCQKKASSPVLTTSPGSPQMWDVGSQLIKRPLPPDIPDAYLEFHRAPGMSFGVWLAHKSLTARHHERHDLIFYVHNGAARVHVGEKDYYASIGDAIYIPRGAVYSAAAARDEQLQFFAVFTPAFDGNDVVYQRSDTTQSQ